MVSLCRILFCEINFMATYAQIDEAYSIRKHSGLKSVVKFCRDNDLYTKDGSEITIAVAQKSLRIDSLRVYSYTDEELQDARENGSVIGVDWRYKFESIAAPYIEISDDYGLSKHDNQQSIIALCLRCGLYTRDGQPVTPAILRKALADDGLRVYNYADPDDLQEARDSGSVIGIDWHYKFATL
jgi:hypothetical protein